MKLIFRPLEGWPGKKEPHPKRAPFKAGWSDTLDILDREVWNLRDYKMQHDPVVLQVDVKEAALRLDGGLRADARADYHGVVISFSSIHGDLRYRCDRFDVPAYGMGASSQAWQCNVRAIALGLEALRKVDRYGIGQDGEQYRGFTAIGTGIPMEPAPMDYTEARRFMSQWSQMILPSVPPAYVIEQAYRAAAKRLHPDVGGDEAQFKRLQEAHRILTA